MNRSPLNLRAYLFLIPFSGVFIFFTLIPLVQSVGLATQHAFGPDATMPVGMEKFSDALSDPRFWLATRNTLVFTAGSVFIQLPIALGLALALNRPNLKGRGFLRLLFFSPQLVGLVFVAVLGSIALEKQKGLINVLLAGGSDTLRTVLPDFMDGWVPSSADMLGIPWLETLAMPALILTALWMYAGFNMVYFLAALQNVSKDLKEAAELDGAGAWGRFVHVTLPAIKPVAAFVVLLSIIGSFQLFELPYVMLAEGVGLQDRGLTIVTYLYKSGFEAGDLGYATAIGWLLAAALAAVAIGQRLLTRDA